MLEALEEHWPEETSWTHPQGGLFLWAFASERINTRDFLEKAVAVRVAYVPGFAFYPGEKGGEHAMRLNFSNANEEMINEGIYRLGLALKAELVRNRG
jgi:2-aminoadipate transaminase